MLKGFALGAAALIGAAVMVLASASEARTLDEIVKSGTIRVGVNPTLPPLGKFDEKNEIVGFDVDFATEIAKMLGVKLEVVQVGSPDRIPFVGLGQDRLRHGGHDAQARTRQGDRLHACPSTPKCLVC